MKKVSLIFGTRPEAIKLCPLALALQACQDIEVQICVTGQHREMLDQVLQVFGLTPDDDLQLMRSNQTLADITSRAFEAIDRYLEREQPDLVLVQGDTTTAFCAAMCAFYRKIPIGHVEAGLRTGNPYSPFPEEINRTLTTRLANLHFAPTESARQNLLYEHVDDATIKVTGNTVIDALFFAIEQIRKLPPTIESLPSDLNPQMPGPRVVLVTGHRRENFGEGLQNICNAILDLAKKFPEIHFVYPVHLNPNVRTPVERLLRSSGRQNIHLIEPLDYLPFVAMLDRSTMVLTDSGGIQEEAPALGKPVLVMRDTTERPEAIEMGTAKLIGTDRETIVDEVTRLLLDDDAYQAMASTINPYGDGNACRRIVEEIVSFLHRKGS